LSAPIRGRPFSGGDTCLPALPVVPIMATMADAAEAN